MSPLGLFVDTKASVLFVIQTVYRNQQQTFSEFLAASLKCTLNFEHLE